MARYLVSYDLRPPGQEYPSLIARLRELGAVRVLKSQWVLHSTSSPKVVADWLLAVMDANDRILVNELTTNYAQYNLLADIPS